MIAAINWATVGLTFLATILVLVGGVVALVAWSVRDDRQTRRIAKQQLENWRRNRRRAPIVKVATIDGRDLVGWRFYIQPGLSPLCAVQFDPTTREPIIWGYSLTELREISRSPSEFEQPDLAWRTGESE